MPPDELPAAAGRRRSDGARRLAMLLAGLIAIAIILWVPLLHSTPASSTGAWQSAWHGRLAGARLHRSGGRAGPRRGPPADVFDHPLRGAARRRAGADFAAWSCCSPAGWRWSSPRSSTGSSVSRPPSTSRWSRSRAASPSRCFARFDVGRSTQPRSWPAVYRGDSGRRRGERRVRRAGDHGDAGPAVASRPRALPAAVRHRRPAVDLARPAGGDRTARRALVRSPAGDGRTAGAALLPGVRRAWRAGMRP